MSSLSLYTVQELKFPKITQDVLKQICNKGTKIELTCTSAIIVGEGAYGAIKPVRLRKRQKVVKCAGNNLICLP